MIRIEIDAIRGTTSYKFTSDGERYEAVEADASHFEAWLSNQPVRQAENDRRSIEGAR